MTFGRYIFPFAVMCIENISCTGSNAGLYVRGCGALEVEYGEVLMYLLYLALSANDA